MGEKRNSSSGHRSGRSSPYSRETSAKKAALQNQVQEAQQMREWISKEDAFLLKQAKKRSEIRVREGRGRVLDYLTVSIKFVEDYEFAEDWGNELEGFEFVLVPSWELVDSAAPGDLPALIEDMNEVIRLEKNSKYKTWWRAVRAYCKRKVKPSTTADSGLVPEVQSDIEEMLSAKSSRELEALEDQVSDKLDSGEVLDYDYWYHLDSRIKIWKSKTVLREYHREIIHARRKLLDQEARIEARHVKDQLRRKPVIDATLPPSPSLLLSTLPPDNTLPVIDYDTYMSTIEKQRQQVRSQIYVPLIKSQLEPISHADNIEIEVPRDATNASFIQLTEEMERNTVNKGHDEYEDAFDAEADVVVDPPSWAHIYPPKKPRYFNRVMTGYDWNRYNQTHYTEDNPPPKIVQGYKFNIFYPDLIDPSKAPTYRVERNQRKIKGGMIGEEETCLIRFISGPPYEDVVFRIVDKDWDKSSKIQAGFKNSFNKVWEIVPHKDLR